MASYIRVNLDTSKENYLLEKCIQHDNITLEASIFENGVVKDLAGYGITINILKPDGTFVIDTASGTEVVGNKITKLLNEQVTTVDGMAKVMVTLNNAQTLQNSTFEFKLLIKEFIIDGAVASSNAVPIVQELTDKITEAGTVKAETERLINEGGAVTKGELNNYATKQELKATDDKLTQDIAKFNQEGLVFGQEYLNPFHTKVKAWNFPEWVQPNNKLKVVFSGDSTTENYSGVYGGLDTYLEQFASADGLYMINAICKGHSGEDTEHWNNKYAVADVTDTNNKPDLYIIRWGINDPYYSKVDNSNLGEQTTPNPNRRTATEFNASLRAGLQKIRAQRPYTDLPIVLMTPSSTNDVPNGRDSAWYESIIPYIRQAARDFQCVFIDTYQYLYDSTNAIDTMDNPYSDGRHIHPNEMRNSWIVGLIYETILPKSIINQCATNKITQATSGDLMKKVTDLPSTYPFGISMYRTSDGFPFDGHVITFKSMDGVVTQLNHSYRLRDPKGLGFRYGGQLDDTWSEWQILNTGFTSESIEP
ncbi:MAG: GDSL-type esterase/lipase family protein, partial [Clostridium sp.]